MPTPQHRPSSRIFRQSHLPLPLGEVPSAHTGRRGEETKPSQSKIRDFCHIFIGMLATGKHIDTYSLRYSQRESQVGGYTYLPYLPPGEGVKSALAIDSALKYYLTNSMTTLRLGSVPVEWVVMFSISCRAEWIT